MHCSLEKTRKNALQRYTCQKKLLEQLCKSKIYKYTGNYKETLNKTTIKLENIKKL